MDFVEMDYFNVNGKGKKTKVKKQKTDKSGKNIFTKDGGGLSSTSKVLIGGAIAGATAIAASKIKKKDNSGNYTPTQSITYNNPTQSSSENKLLNDPQKNDATDNNSKDKGKNKTMLYIGIGVGVLLLVGIVIYSTRNR